MENKIEIFKNEELGELRTVLNTDGSISVNAEDTAIGFGWYQEKKGIKYPKWERINGFIDELGFSPQVEKDNYIPESLFYLLGMKANNKAAQKFQMWLAKDVIPSIRKHGLYITEELLKDKQKLESELDQYMQRYEQLEYEKRLIESKNEEIEEENVEFRKQRQTIFRLSVKTGQDESYLPELVIQIIRNYINDNADVVLNERDEHIFIKKAPLFKELRKLIMQDRGITEVLYSMGMDIQDRIVIIPNKFMDKDYKPIGSLYL